MKDATRDTHTLLAFLDGDYEFDEAAFREDTIGNFPRGESPDSSVSVDAASGSPDTADTTTDD